MRNNARSMLFVLGLGLVFFALPAQAVETRFKSFQVLCDGTARTTLFVAGSLGASVSRFVQGISVVITDPRGGLISLRVQGAGDETKMLAAMGFHEVSTHRDFTASVFQFSTDASGNVPFQIVTACAGSGHLKGQLILMFFS